MTCKPKRQCERIWEARVHIHRVKEQHLGKAFSIHANKMNSRGASGYFVGIGNESRYRVWDRDWCSVESIALACLDDGPGYDEYSE